MHAIAPDMRYSTMSAPPVLAFADDPVRGRRLIRLIEATGARLVAEGPLTGAIHRIDRQVGPGALIVIDIADDGGRLLDEMLARIDAGVRIARFAAIVVTTHAMLDLVVARLADPATMILVDPGEDDVVDAVSRALAPVEAMLWESSGEANTAGLRN
jgi:hypothetical protein